MEYKTVTTHLQGKPKEFLYTMDYGEKLFSAF